MDACTEAVKQRKTLKYVVIVPNISLLVWPLTFGLVWLVDAGYSGWTPPGFLCESRVQTILKSVPPDAPEAQSARRSAAP